MENIWMTIPEMTEYMRVSRKTAYNLVKCKAIPSYRTSPRKTLVKKADIDKYITRHKR